MFLLFTDPSACWQDLCYNPHAHEDITSLFSNFHELARGETVRASQNLLTAWARAFGALRDTCIWSSGSSWRCPDDVPVLVLRGIRQVLKYVNNPSLPRTDVPVHVASPFRAQLWAFRCIRAAALARWLRAVGIVMSRAPFLADMAGMGDFTDFTDIIDIILAQLAAWHAALPHDEALPLLQPWVGV